MIKKLLPIAIIIFTAQQLFAVGALFARRPLTEDDYRTIWLKTLTVDVQVQDQMAITHVDHIFQNETNNPLEGIFIFPLPEEAIVTSLTVWIDGVPVDASIQDSDTARAIYETEVKNGLSPALLEDMGDNIFKLSVYPIDEVGQLMSERRIEITYAELLPYAAGTISYRFHNKTEQLSSREVEQTDFTFSLGAQKEILSLTSPSHPSLTTQRHSSDSLSASYSASSSFSGNDIILSYTEKSDTFTIHHLTYVPDTMFFDIQDSAPLENEAFDYYTWDNTPYVLFWVTPPDTTTNQTVLTKEIVFVADISSSMDGTRLDQVKQSLHQMIDLLNDGDKFNIVLFNSTTQSYSDTLVTADAVTKAATTTFIDTATGVGLTNIEQAFDVALNHTFADTTMHAIIFLTDGKPTWPVTTSNSIVVEQIATNNTNSTKIFTFGIGTETDKLLLEQIAYDHNGYSTIILEDDSISTVMTDFMREISHPLLTDIQIDFGTQTIYNRFPHNTPNLYDGSQLTLLGRYNETQSTTTTVQGNVGGQAITLATGTDYPSPAGNHPFVARLWASHYIDYLLDEIDHQGETNTLTREVIATSLRYAILTPYTSYLVEDTSITPLLDARTPLHKDLSLTLQNYSGAQRLQLSIPELATPQKATLKIYDLKGRLIATLFNEYSQGGNYLISLAQHNLGRGFYVAVLQVGSVNRMVKLRI